jgi:signal transduction histidine kinase
MAMAEAETSAGLDRLRSKIDRRLRLVPFAALAASTGLVLIAGGDSPVRFEFTLAVVLVTAAWLYWMVVRHPQWERRPRLMALFFVVQLALIALLVFCHPLYGFFAWTGYLSLLYALRDRWRLAGAAGVGFCTAVSQMGGFGVFVERNDLPAFAVVLAFNIGIGVSMTFLASVSDGQAIRRQQMLEELAEANAKLAAAMRENAGLHAQLLTQAREAGALDERQRMAGEIHDVLAQGLTGIVTQLEAADQAAARPADWRRHLVAAKQLARESLSEARRSVQALTPQPLAAAALPEALAEVVNGWSSRNGVTAELFTTGTAEPLLPEIETTLLRTAQEALANVARHAGASRVALTLSYMGDLVSLDVRDDGTGFDPAAPRPEPAVGGFGLAAMRERVRRMAGTLEVESEPGGGTAISACVPAIAVPAAAA